MLCISNHCFFIDLVVNKLDRDEMNEYKGVLVWIFNFLFSLFILCIVVRVIVLNWINRQTKTNNGKHWHSKRPRICSSGHIYTSDNLCSHWLFTFLLKKPRMLYTAYGLKETLVRVGRIVVDFRWTCLKRCYTYLHILSVDWSTVCVKCWYVSIFGIFVLNRNDFGMN